MCGGWFGNRLTAAFATAFGMSLMLAANNLSAPQQRHINQANPDLDSADQLPPSQMRQPLPGAVSQPASAERSPAQAARHAGRGPAGGAGTRPLACSGTVAQGSRLLQPA